MTLDLDKTNIRLENTTNKMLSLKNLQFMEARVHDDIESTINTAADSNTLATSDNKVTYLTLMIPT